MKKDRLHTLGGALFKFTVEITPGEYGAESRAVQLL